MRWIELLGPSGVGKSFVYNQLIIRNTNLDPNKKVLERVRASKEYTHLPRKIKFFYLIYSLNLPRVSDLVKRQIIHYLKSTFEKKRKDIYNDTDLVIIDKYLNSILSLKDSSIITLKKISHFHQKYREHKFFDEFLEQDDLYLAEDGIAHLVPVFLTEFQPFKVIVLQRHVDNVIKQRLYRSKLTPTSFSEFLLNEKNLTELVRSDYKLYQDKLDEYTSSLNTNQIYMLNLDDGYTEEDLERFILSDLTNE